MSKYLIDELDNNISQGEEYSMGDYAKLRKLSLDIADDALEFTPLFDELLVLLESYLGSDDIGLIKKVIKRAESRILKSSQVVQLVDKEDAEGTVSVLDDGTVLDERMGNHDILSLTSLVYSLRNEEGQPIDKGLSFFLNYMKEFEAEGVDSIIFTLDKSKMVAIHFERDLGLFHYSPVKAASSLALYIESPVFKYNLNNSSFFVLVNGLVAAPAIFESDSCGIYYNTKKIESGELFLFEGEDTIATRLCFKPYEYKDIQVIDQHGSAIYGESNQFYHSCSSAIFDDVEIDKLRTDLMSISDSDEMVLFEYLFYGEYSRDNISKILSSELTPSKLTIEQEIYNSFNRSARLVNLDKEVALLLNNYLPLTHRFDAIVFDKTGRLIKDSNVKIYKALAELTSLILKD